MPELRVRRDDLATCEIVDPPVADPEEGEALLQVERFALSANNITYAAFGHQLGYWKLFPAPEGWGRIPAWGYAHVAEARSPAVAEGQRVFGLVPMGSRLTVRPEARGPGFADAAPHRAELSPVYNQYLPAADDAGDAALIMRPLFGTSILLDLALSDAGFHGAETVVITSASSKTAYGLAHQLRARRVQVVGLTSGRHREWVEGLGLYDRVLSYDDVAELSAPGGAVVVDFAGNRELLDPLGERLGDALRRTVLVGFVQRGEAPEPGPGTEFFFAPDEIVRRGRELAESWAGAWRDFALVVERAMRIELVTGGDELVRVYRDLLEGRADPAVGYTCAW